MEENIGDAIYREVKIIDKDNIQLQLFQMEYCDQLGDSSEDQKRQDNDKRYKNLPFPILVGGLTGQPQTFDFEVDVAITAAEYNNNN